MAASSSNDARTSSRAERFELLRELGSRNVPVWAALESLPNARARLVVAERVLRGRDYSEQDIANWVRDARRLAMLDHPNVARVREVVLREDDVLVVSDFVDGMTWRELASSRQAPSLEVALRVFVDVLSGLSAVHNLRDAKRQPVKLVHGELTPDCVLVGLDGVARVIGAHRMRAGTAGPEGSASAYLAPEVLLADDAADARADVYSVGAMLWEALSGRALFANTVASAIVTQILSGRVPRATVPAASPWAAPLVDAVASALTADAGKRFGSTAAFAAELRRVAGPKLAPSVRVAALVRAMCGDQIRARREALERVDGPCDEVSAVATERTSIEVPIDVAIDVEDRGWTAPPPTPTTPRTRIAPQPPAPPPTSPRAPVEPALAVPRAPVEASAPKPTASAVAPPAARAALPPLKLPPPRLPAGPCPAPEAPLVVPAIPLLPMDLGASSQPRAAAPSEAESTGVGEEARPTLSPPAGAPSPSPESLRITHPAPRRRNSVVLIVGPAALLSIAVVWWFAARTTAPVPVHVTSPVPAAPAAAPLPPTTSASEVATPLPSTTAAGETVHLAEPPAESAPPAAPSSDDVGPAATPVTTAAAAESPSPLAAPAPPMRPIVKRKYDPQGI